MADDPCMWSPLVQFGIVMMGAMASCAVALVVAFFMHRRTRAAQSESRTSADARRDDQPLARVGPISDERVQPVRKAA
jgi:hypothetical protein